MTDSSGRARPVADSTARSDLAHGLAQRLREIGDQVVAVLDADRDADQRHRRCPSPRGARDPSPRRSCARPVSRASGCRRDSTTSTTIASRLRKVEAVDAVGELEREESAVAAEQRARERMLRMRRQSRVVDARTCGCAARNSASASALAQCAPSAARASPRRPRCGARRSAASVPPQSRSPFLRDLLDAPHRGRLRLVVLGDVGKARPVEETRVGDAAGERVAVAADVLGERVDDEPGADGLRPEQRRRGHRVVDDVENAALPRHSSPMRARSATCVRGLAIVSTKTSASPGVSARSHVGDVGRVDERDVVPVRRERAEAGSPCCRTGTGSTRRGRPRAAARASSRRSPPCRSRSRRCATPSSIFVTFASSAADVGLPCRPYA